MIIDGAPRLLNLINSIESEQNVLLQKYIDERKGWHLFYDILDFAETQIKAKDEWMLSIKSKAEKILLSSKIN